MTGSRPKCSSGSTRSSRNPWARKAESRVNTREHQRVLVDLRATAEDSPGTVRVFDLVERGADARLVGGTTFITLAQP